MTETYQVLVRGPRGEKQTIDLCNTEEQFKSMTVLQLKEKIAEKLPYHPGRDDLRLKFTDKVLDGDSKLLSEFGIQDKSIIEFVLLLRAVTVVIRGPDGRTTEIKLQDFESATVLFLKTEIRDSLGYPEKDHRLICEGRELEDSSLLSAYGIKPYSTIYMNKRLRGGGTVLPLKGGDGMGDRDGRNRSMETLTPFLKPTLNS